MKHPRPSMPHKTLASIPAILLAWVACGDTAPQEKDSSPSSEGALHPVNHALESRDSESGDSENGDSDVGALGRSGSESGGFVGSDSDGGDFEHRDSETSDTVMPDVNIGEPQPGVIEPDPGGVADTSWFDDVQLYEEGSPVDEESRTHLLNAMKPVLAAYREDARVAGATLRLTVRWSSTVSGAQAATQPGKIWEIIAEGGLSRDPADRITHVGCHEMGHLVGGFPFLSGIEIIGSTGGPRTAEDHALVGTSEGAEGQADYFSTKECLPRAWGNDDNSSYEALVAPEFKARCDAAYGDPAQRQLCYRILVSSLEKMQATTPSSFYGWNECEVYDAWHTNPYCEDLLEPTPTSRPEFIEPKILTFGYPSRLCRLETYIRGALCPIKVPRVSETGGPFVVPGDVETPWGYGVVADETRAAAAPYACQGDHPGARPPCWYNEDVLLPGCEGTGLEPHESVCEDGMQRDCGTPLRADERGPYECRRGCDDEGISCIPLPAG